MRMKISRKEAKESTYWLKLITVSTDYLLTTKSELASESVELTKIFTAICRKTQ